MICTSDNGPVIDDGYKDDAAAKLGTHSPSGPRAPIEMEGVTPFHFVTGEFRSRSTGTIARSRLG